LSAWVHVSEFNKIKKFAEDQGVTISDVLKAQIEYLDDDIAMIQSRISMLKRKETPSTVAG